MAVEMICNHYSETVAAGLHNEFYCGNEQMQRYSQLSVLFSWQCTVIVLICNYCLSPLGTV